MKRELTGPKVQLVLKEQNMKMRDFNFFKESLFLQERFWEAVLKVRPYNCGGRAAPADSVCKCSAGKKVAPPLARRGNSYSAK